MKILMSPPDYYGIEYEINPWMNKKIEVNKLLARSQWKNLYNEISKYAAVQLLEPQKGFPDLVFTANAGWLYQNKMYLAHFRYRERQGETPFFIDWCKKQGYQLTYNAIEDPNLPFFEGEGDILMAGEKIFGGYGFRTDRRFYEVIPEIKASQLILCELINPYFYHLDTCFSPLNDFQGIWFPKAFSSESQKHMSEQLELFEVSEQEAKTFCCNAVVLGKNIIMNAHCPELTRKLTDLGFKVVHCDMSEFIKAGGACKCLTLKLDA